MLLTIPHRGFLCIFLSVALFSVSAIAEKRIDLYQDDQLVLDQSESLRKQAVAKGLSAVLVKMSGQQQVLLNPLIKDALTRAESYLLRYSYESTEETIVLAGEQRQARRLRLFYSPTAVKRIMTSAQIPLWFENRPEVLFWLAGDRQGKRLLDSESSVIKDFKSVAYKRGLPLVVPLLDLNDRQQLPVARLWAMDEATIRQASARYSLDGILAGRVQQSGSQWSGRFLLIHKGQRQYFTATAATSQNLANRIIAQAAAYYATQDAVVVNEEHTAPSMTVTVDNIQGFEHYAALLTLLEELPIIAAVMVSHVDAETVTLELSYSGTTDKVLSALANVSLIQQVDASDGIGVDAHFIWR